jgi:protein-S-isoprenylcysteine O-methyltransferase Ste14
MMKNCENPKKIVLPPGYLFISLLLMSVTHWLTPGITIVPGPVKIFGLVFVVLGVLLNIAAKQAMKKAQTPVSPFAKTTSLITWGIHSWTRNPMYLGMVLLLLGVTILMGSMLPMIITLLFALIMHYRFVKMEEEKLADQFKEKWDDYRSLTRRWL